MKKNIFLAIMAAAVAAMPVCAAPASGAAPAEKAKPEPSAVKADKRVGVIFNLMNPLSGALPYYDGYQFGAGGKVWLDGALAIRALAGLYSIVPVAGDASTLITLGAGIEYHAKGEASSPYCGALAGIGINAIPAGTTTSLYIGAMGGVELRVIEKLSLFGEYQLKLIVSPAGTTFALADIGSAASGAALGVILYF